MTVVVKPKWFRWAFSVLALLLLVVLSGANEWHPSRIQNVTNRILRWKKRLKTVVDTPLRMLRRGRGWVASGNKIRLTAGATFFYVLFLLKEKIFKVSAFNFLPFLLVSSSASFYFALYFTPH